MKRLWIVMLALAIVPLLTMPAAAKKGGIPGPPDKPDDEPPVSVTCVSPWWDGDFKTDDFDIVLTRDQPDACVDVLTETETIWVATVTLEPDTTWKRPELMMVPRDAAWLSDSCGGIKRVGDSVFDPWVFPAWDEREFTIIPKATVNACPGWDAATVGGEGIGEFSEFVEFEDGSPSQTIRGPDPTISHPLAFVVWSHNLRKGETVNIHVDVQPVLDN